MKANKQKDFSKFFNTMLKMRKILHQTLDDTDGDNIPTMLQVQTLKTIKENSPITASELASRLQMSPSALTQMTDRLIKSKFISRKNDKNDRRLILLSLTNDGEQHLASILKRMEQKANQILDPISAKDLETVVTIFEDFLQKYEK
ncbi:MAG: MarR family winged helix-turn-helix transcriptional regulator [Candidatus Bilamarchaeum sp.]|nr:MarR family transcriptional regulator [Methanofastidiosum sp.]